MLVRVYAAASRADPEGTPGVAAQKTRSSRWRIQVRVLWDEGDMNGEVASKKMKIFHFSLLTSSRSLVSC